MRNKSKTRGNLLRVLAVLAIVLSLLPPLPAAVTASWTGNAADQDAATAAAPVVQVTNTLKLRVISARTEPRAFDGAGVTKGAAVTNYKWLISVDNTGNPDQPYFPDCSPYLQSPPAAPNTPNPNYPDNCDYPGVRTVPGWAPVYTQGDQTNLNQATGVSLPPGKYLISVWGDGYKMDGEHFSVPLADPGLITVEAHPEPLPPATMVIQVYNDQSMTNGQWDAQVEPGLPGFRARIHDILGEVTNDLFGNPLCTIYQHDAQGNVVFDPITDLPIIQTLGHGCYSDANGIITIPNIGTIRWDVLVDPPDGTNWIQTTTLEGSFGWDTWLQEAGTGLDNEFIVAGEPTPWTLFGYVQPKNTLTPGAGKGSIKGVIMGSITASPAQGGLPYQGRIWGGFGGTALDTPIANPWIAINDLQNGDTAIWVGQGNADGSFQVDNLPPGDYTVTYWDQNIHYILDFDQATVKANAVTDIGVRTMTYWFTKFYGTVFDDLNENGRRDAGEPGIPNYLVVLKDRDNTEIDRMSIAQQTAGDGSYEFAKAYPMGSWMVLEAYSDRYRTTGVTYQVWNQPAETTIMGAGVDVDVLPVLGQPARLDWGVRPYAAGTNGGIVGTVSYDTMRAEDNAQFAGAEPWQPGIPGLTMNLYATVKDVNGNFVKEADGSYKKGALLNTATTETFERPKNCQARDVDGNPVNFPALAVYDPTGVNAKDCLEAPSMGTQVGNEFATLDGNYGFSEMVNDPVTGLPLPAPVALPMGDYLVEVVIPNDPVFNKPLFQVTREEDVNMYNGNAFIPTVPPPLCAGALHTVDIAGIAPDGANAVVNPGYVDVGGSRYEGQQMPLCNVKLVPLANERSIAPIFTLFTEVPIPGKWKGYIIDNLQVSSNPLQLFFGEMMGAPLPIGIYDYTGRRVHTVYSDMHGVYEVLLPSSATTNAPTPAGQLANVYYIYGNDPGPADAPDPKYNPQYRSIGTSFEIYPGVMVPSDLAPTQNGVFIWSPTSQVNISAQCKLPATVPQIFKVQVPYGSPGVQFAINGQGFGATRGSGQVYLGTRPLTIVSWSDTQVTVSVPNDMPGGAHQLSVLAGNGERSVSGLTFHVRAGSYMPRIYEVGPNRTGARQYNTLNPIYNGQGRGPIQHAMDDAYADGRSAVVVVYPDQPVAFTNPMGVYFENLVMYAPVKLQGVGPGGVRTDGTSVRGSILDGRAIGGDTPYTTWWRGTLLPTIWNQRGGWDGSVVDAQGDPFVYEGAVITVLAENGEFTSSFNATIDGFLIQGGDQQGMPGNIQQIGGAQIPGATANIVVQGGGIYVEAYARYLQISNNLIQSNGGAYAGGIRIGTPDVPGALNDHQNDNVRIVYNRLLANGGTNLAGAIGLFAGAANYTVANNDICGNYSAEYGGGISHYGYSPNGKIHHNRIYFNQAYDEGGGIMIAGELPAVFTQLSTGAGPVDVYNNLIQSNLSNDDGGGLRFLMAGNFPYNVYNNMIVNNVSTHEGGGIALNDAPNVRVFNNTIMKNVTTATAMTSTGLPAPAGLSTNRNSNLLQATLPVGSPIFSNPTLFNNIFWNNKAGTLSGGGVSGIGLPGDPSPVFYWDMAVADGSGVLAPRNTIMQQQNDLWTTPHFTNIIGQAPGIVAGYDTSVTVLPWRGNANFIGVNLVAVDLPVDLMGDYHITATSPALGAGRPSYLGINAATVDFDDQTRPNPTGTPVDIGADERQ